MDTNASASSVPAVPSFESYDVFSGKDGLSRAEYKKSTFHDTDMVSGDAMYDKTALLMGGSGATILSDSNAADTSSETKADAKTLAQGKEAAV